MRCFEQTFKWYFWNMLCECYLLNVIWMFLAKTYHELYRKNHTWMYSAKTFSEQYQENHFRLFLGKTQNCNKSCNVEYFFTPLGRVGIGHGGDPL